MKSIVVMGVDPGLAHLGYALVRLSPEGNSLVEDENGPVIGLIETSKSARKKGVRDSDDNTRRARELYVPLKRIVQKHDVRCFCTEAMSYPRSSTASHKMGISWGIIVAISSDGNIPITQASPSDIKKTVCGVGTASKEEVQRALSERYGVPVDTFTKTRREHPFDALGAVEACLDSEILIMVRDLWSED